MTDDPLARAVLQALGARPSLAKRREIASQLRHLADRQEQIAAAEDAQRGRPAAERVAPRKPHAGPGRAPSRFVRIVRDEKPGRVRVYVGRGLFYELGSPKRLDVQRLSGHIELRPVSGDAGYSVQTGNGMPRFFADGARDLLDDLADGRYDAEIRAGAIVVGDRLA